MKRTDRLTMLVSVVLFLTFLAYAGVYGVRHIQDTTVTADATATTVSVDTASTGMIVRQESLLISSERYLAVTAKRGERVATGGQLAVAMRNEEGLARARRMQELEVEIEQVAAVLSGTEDTGDLNRREARIRQSISDLSTGVVHGNIEQTESASVNLRSLIFTGVSDATNMDLRALRNELAALQESSSVDTASILARDSGVFSDALDGWEHVGPEALDNLTPDGLNALIDSRETIPDNAYGKLVTDYVWYYAAALPASEASRCEVGREVTLNFGRYYDGDVPAQIVSVSEPDNNINTLAVVFRCDTALADTLTIREVTATVSFGQYSGVRVPIEAVQVDEEDGSDYVWVITARQLERKPVHILYTGDGFYVVEREMRPDALREGNTIVVSGEDLREGKIVT